MKISICCIREELPETRELLRKMNSSMSECIAFLFGRINNGKTDRQCEYLQYSVEALDFLSFIILPRTDTLCISVRSPLYKRPSNSSLFNYHKVFTYSKMRKQVIYDN